MLQDITDCRSGGLIRLWLAVVNCPTSALIDYCFQQYDEQQRKLSDEVEEMQNKIDMLRVENQSQQTEVSEKRKQLEEAKDRCEIVNYN